MSEGTASTTPIAKKTDITTMSTEPSNRELKGLSVEKLTSADDYQLWSYRLESAFQAMELWGYIDGSHPEPDEKTYVSDGMGDVEKVGKESELLHRKLYL
jgi:gag-polypeptide of LTR copia-type